MVVEKIINSGDDDIEHIRAYPGPVTLYRSRPDWYSAAGGIGMVALGGAGMVVDHNWFLALFVVAGALAAAGGLLPGANSVTLGPVHFEIVSGFWRSRTRWQDVSQFSVDRNGGGVVYSDRKRRGPWRALVGAYTGSNAGVASIYGLAAPAFANLMNRWRSNALAAHSGQSDVKQRATGA